MTFLNDKQRAALMAFLTSIFPVLNLVGVLNLTGDEVSLIMLMIGNGLTYLALIIPSTAATTTTVVTPSNVATTAVIKTGPPPTV